MSMSFTVPTLPATGTLMTSPSPRRPSLASTLLARANMAKPIPSPFASATDADADADAAADDARHVPISRYARRTSAPKVKYGPLGPVFIPPQLLARLPAPAPAPAHSADAAQKNLALLAALESARGRRGVFAPRDDDDVFGPRTRTRTQLMMESDGQAGKDEPLLFTLRPPPPPTTPRLAKAITWTPAPSPPRSPTARTATTTSSSSSSSPDSCTSSLLDDERSSVSSYTEDDDFPTHPKADLAGYFSNSELDLDEGTQVLVGAGALGAAGFMGAAPGAQHAFAPIATARDAERTKRSAPATAPAPAPPRAGFRPAARPKTTPAPAQKTKYLYQGGESTVLTGGVMLGGGSPSPARSAPSPRGSGVESAPKYRVPAARSRARAAAAVVPEGPWRRTPARV